MRALLAALWFGPENVGGAREFFEDESGALSMTRLLNFLAFWPASYAFVLNPTEGMAGIYLGVFAGTYAVGKGIDAWKAKPASPPAQIAGTVVNQTGGSTDVTSTGPAPLGP